MENGKIKVAILGVGNCASSFVQGIYHYSNNNSEDGLISDVIGGYKVSDIEVVAAYDINSSKVGKDLSVDDGYKAAERCGLSIISQAKVACSGDLSKIKSCVKLTGFVNSTDNFTEQPKVINGASDLIASVFGEAGMHTRAAVSTNSLPLGVSVEVDAIFELN